MMRWLAISGGLGKPIESMTKLCCQQSLAFEEHRPMFACST